MNMNKLFAIAVFSAAAASPASHAAEAKDTLAAFHAALAAGDRTRALEALAPQAVIYESGYVERSRDEYASHHLGGDMAFAKTATRKVLKQSEHLAGNTAIVWQETETTGTARGQAVHVLGTETAVLQKQGDAWTIVHIHWSSRKAK
ncbi:YybH family protein [Pseudoduganella sp. GCM10020061]|uniref:YybH family protein n=1 Tax=Pseudoduganella sp. GCM10020061 TaxID=3317345 RepID=UPI00362C13A4